MFQLSVVLITLVCFLSSRALAIDCARATQAYEKAICADPKLVAADDELNRFYFERLRSLTGRAHDLLQADQRHWVDDRGGKCRPLTTGCLAKTIADRRREVAICSRLAGSALEGPEHKAICLYYQHSGCPSLYAWGSAGLVRYPFLVTRLIGTVTDDLADFACEPERARGTAQPDGASLWIEIEAERPGFVFVHTYDDGCERGWAKCMSMESLDATNASTEDIVGFSTLFNDASPSRIYARLLPYIEGHLSMPCCGDITMDGTARLANLKIDRADRLPDGWSVTPAGDLVVAYQYNGAGHTLLSRATIPRSAFITMLAPKYTALFDPLPR